LKNKRNTKEAGNRRDYASKGRRKRSKGVRILLWSLCTLLILLVLIVGGGYAALRIITSGSGSLPSLQDQKSITNDQTTRIYAADGSILAYIYGDQNRTVVSTQQISAYLKNGIVAIEDQRFYQHHGVDYRGLIRAIFADIKAGKAVQGASTITEQLVGNLYLDRRDNSITRKIKEAQLASEYEKKYTKEQILTEYLNTVYFGANAYGVEAAAQTYFGKGADQLTLAESAMIVGLPQAPTSYNPRQYPDKALTRRNEVLAAMLKQKYITQTQYDPAVNTPIKLSTSSTYTQVKEPYVVDYTKQQLVALVGSDKAYTGGLGVQTTINPKYQQLAKDAISSTLNRKGDPSAAVVSIDPKTGYIVAMVTSSDYDKSKFNLAVQARRQPGSTFKTFVLATAIGQGIDPYSTYYDSKPVQLTYAGSTKPWSVHTYGNKYYGISSIFQATLRSDNTVYAQLALDVGINNIVNTAHRMGVTSDLNTDPAVALGGLTVGVSPLEMASAYGTLANNGSHVSPTIISKIWDSTGKTIYEAKPEATQALSPAVAYATTQILEQNIQRGTGTAADIGRPAAGKTGTTSDYADAWFCGYTPNLSTTIWVGYPQGKVSMTDVHGVSVTGGTFPAQIWQKFMYTADRSYPKTDFTVPGTLVQYSNGFQSNYAVTSTTTSTSTTSTTLPGQTTTTSTSSTSPSTSTTVPVTTTTSTTTPSKKPGG